MGLEAIAEGEGVEEQLIKGVGLDKRVEDKFNGFVVGTGLIDMERGGRFVDDGEVHFHHAVAAFYRGQGIAIQTRGR